MGALFTSLFAKLASIVRWIGDLAVAVFTALWDFVRDAACWPFEQLMDVVVSAVQALDLSGFAQYAHVWGDLPAELVNILGLLGIGQASAIIVMAIGIRLVLQLIPFTRLGS